MVVLLRLVKFQNEIEVFLDFSLMHTFSIYGVFFLHLTTSLEIQFLLFEVVIQLSLKITQNF